METPKQNNRVLKVYWNFTDKKWNLVEIGTVIPEGNYCKSYVIPAEAHFIDPKKSRIVRIAWKLHKFIEKIKFKIYKLRQKIKI